MRGKLHGRQQMEYTLAAKDGQTLSMYLKCSPAGTLTLRISDPKGREVPLKPVRRQRWSVPLHATGDYGIDVVRSKAGSIASAFTLTLALH